MTAGGSKRYLAFIPVPVLIVTIAVLYLTVSPSLFFEPAWLILIANTLFITALCLTVSFLAMKNFMETGLIQILLLGCGVLTFGIGAAIAGLFRNIPEVGANINVTVYNTGALIAAVFHCAAALILLSGASTGAGSKHKEAWLAFGYIGLTLFMTLLASGSLKGVVPPFFVQGVGPTPLRQIVLGSAVVLFVFSSLIFMGTYLRNRELFLYWYSLALALIAIGLAAVFIQRSVGSPIGWAGRFSQYLGCVYFLAAVMTALRRAQASGSSLISVLSSALSSAEEKFRVVAESSPDAISRFDKGMRFIYANSAARLFYGKPGGDIIGKAIDETSLSEAYRTALKEAIKKVFLSGEPAEMEGEISLDSGKRYYHTLCLPEHGTTDEVSNVFVVSRDLTERKRMEEELERTASIVSSSKDAIIGKTLEGIITSWNPGAEQMYGYTEEEVKGRPVSMLLDEGSPDETTDILRRIERGETVEHYETLRRRKDGSLLNVSLTVSPIRDSAGVIIGASTIARDITARKQAEEERERLIIELREALSKVKTLSGLLPICASCKKVRDDRGYWTQIESYISGHSEAEFSHGLCPDCVRKLYPDLADQILWEEQSEGDKGSSEN